MKLKQLLLILALALLTVPTLAADYPHVQSSIVFAPTTSGAKSINVSIFLRNTGDMPTSCVIKVGGQTKVTGLSANGFAHVTLDVTTYKGYTVTCTV